MDAWAFTMTGGVDIVTVCRSDEITTCGAPREMTAKKGNESPMAAAQTIESQDVNVGGVFQSFYAVPDYQREYVWQTPQVEQLLSDPAYANAAAEVSREMAQQPSPARIIAK